MKLGEFFAASDYFRGHHDFVIEDDEFFDTSVNRLVEDVELTSYVFAKSHQLKRMPEEKRRITHDDLKEGLFAIDTHLMEEVFPDSPVAADYKELGSPGVYIEEISGGWKASDLEAPAIPVDDFHTTPTSGIVNPEKIRAILHSPFTWDEDPIDLLARYFNFKLANVLKRIAASAKQQGSRKISHKHILPFCDKLPYPLNNNFC